jgi:23S rRNA pseudouridine1911/1915/1917 synthase
VILTEVVPPALDGERVDRVVALLTGLARAQVSDLVDAGGVTLRGATVRTRSARVVEGDTVAVDVPDPVDAVAVAGGGADVAFQVVHADDQVIVVDKPPGLVVHPGAGNPAGTLAQGIVARFPEVATVGEPGRPGVVHRLDRGTSGLLVVARTEAARASLVAQLASRQVTRRYVALTWGHLRSPRGVVDAPIGRSRRDPTRMAVTTRGKEARTAYAVEQRYDEPAAADLIGCTLETGRTHQIRVHLAAVGHPVVGDARYGGVREPVAAPRPFLHARQLAFDHPATGERVTFDAPLPADLAAVLAGLVPAEDPVV